MGVKVRARGLLLKWLFSGAAILEDFADRLNHIWTFGLFIVLSLFISWKTTYNKPITCFTPSQFSGAMILYAESVCWDAKAIYRTSDPEFVNNPILSSIEVKNYRTVDPALFKWLPLILILQALLFKLPYFLLLTLHGYSGTSFDKIAGLTWGYERLNLADRRSLAGQVSTYVYKSCQRFRGFPAWRVLSVLWFIVKVLYFVNVIVQLSLLGNFMVSEQNANSTVHSSVGDIFTDNLFTSNIHDIEDLAMLPKTAMCQFQIPQHQNVVKYVINCHLPANRTNEQVIMLLWVWLLFVAIVTGLSLVTWTFRAAMPVMRRRYIARHLEGVKTHDVNIGNHNDLDRFCGFIGEDGVMMLRLVTANSSELITKDAVCHAFSLFSGTSNQKKDENNHMEMNAVQ